ncbi:hypothetical protein GIB67_004505, partial [Kingdonia uniflora]
FLFSSLDLSSPLSKLNQSNFRSSLSLPSHTTTHTTMNTNRTSDAITSFQLQQRNRARVHPNSNLSLIFHVWDELIYVSVDSSDFDFSVERRRSLRARLVYGFITLLTNLLAWLVRDYGYMELGENQAPL